MTLSRSPHCHRALCDLALTQVHHQPIQEIFEFFHQEETVALEEIDQAERRENEGAGRGFRTDIELEDGKNHAILREKSSRLTGVVSEVSAAQSLPISDPACFEVGRSPATATNLKASGAAISEKVEERPQSKNVAVPFLFAASVADVAKRLWESSTSMTPECGFAHRVKGYLHVVVFSPCHLLPEAEHQSLVENLADLLNEGSAGPPISLDMDWAGYVLLRCVANGPCATC
jgi:hypothetical protein